MIHYDFHVALMVPNLARQAANMMVVDTTGNAADIHSFAIECVDDEGYAWWACQMPMTFATYARLPEFQAAIGGHYEALRYFGHQRIEYMGFDEALQKYNLTRVGGGEL